MNEEELFTKMVKREITEEYYERILLANKLKVGQRVEMTVDNIPKKGYRGTIVDIDEINIGIEWDENIGGHSCDGRCKDYHGWYVFPEQLKVIEDE